MNRRQRRAQNSNSSNSGSIKTADDIPYSSASEVTKREKPAQTLLEIAAAKQAQLNPKQRKFNFNPQDLDESIVNVEIGKDGKLIETKSQSRVKTKAASNSPTSKLDSEDDDEDGKGNDDAGTAEIPAWADTLLLSISLSLLHLTLSILTMHQYAEALVIPPLIINTVSTAFPTLFILIHVSRGHLLPSSIQSYVANLAGTSRKRLAWAKQAWLVCIANLAGGYLIHLTNEDGYYAVMKQAPSIGTLWVWSVLEMGLVGALLGVVGPAGWGYWKGYGFW
jgi:hypothetical protein